MKLVTSLFRGIIFCRRYIMVAQVTETKKSTMVAIDVGGM